MGFKIAQGAQAQEKKVWWPVDIYEPLDGGKSRLHKVKVQFSVLPPAEVTDLIEAGGDNAILDRVVADWQGFQDENGAEVALTDDARALYFALPYVRAAVVQTYFQAAVGGRRKN